MLAQRALLHINTIVATLRKCGLSPNNVLCAVIVQVAAVEHCNQRIMCQSGSQAHATVADCCSNILSAMHASFSTCSRGLQGRLPQ